MLKVICNQRDRFRTRLRETEEVFFCSSPIEDFASFLYFVCGSNCCQIYFFVVVMCLSSFAYPKFFTILGNKAVEGEDRGAGSRTGEN